MIRPTALPDIAHPARAELDGPVPLDVEDVGEHVPHHPHGGAMGDGLSDRQQRHVDLLHAVGQRMERAQDGRGGRGHVACC